MDIYCASRAQLVQLAAKQKQPPPPPSSPLSKCVVVAFMIDWSLLDFNKFVGICIAIAI